MQAKVIGFRNVDYVSKKDGHQVTGANLFLVTEGGPKTVGNECMNIYASGYILNRSGYVPVVGDLVDIAWSRYGDDRIDGIRVIKSGTAGK